MQHVPNDCAQNPHRQKCVSICFKGFKAGRSKTKKAKEEKFFVPLPHSNPQTQTSLELEGKQARTPHFHGGEEVQYDLYIYIYIFIYIYMYICVCTYICVYIYIYTHWHAFQFAYMNIDKYVSHVDVYML